MIEESEADDAHKRIVTSKLDALLGLCETANCRRVQLLAYFGEASRPYGNCDTCLEAPATWDGTREAQMALSCVYRVERMSGFYFGAGHLIDILRGNLTERVKQRGHDQLSTFGIGATLTETQWRPIFRQLIAYGLLTADHTLHGALTLTTASRVVLKGEQKVTPRREIKSARAPHAPVKQRANLVKELSASARACWERLRAWRSKTAKAKA